MSVNPYRETTDAPETIVAWEQFEKTGDIVPFLRHTIRLERERNELTAKIPTPPPVATSPRELLPPEEIVDAAHKVHLWMETNNYKNWQLGGICDRRFALKES